MGVVICCLVKGWKMLPCKGTESLQTLFELTTEMFWRVPKWKTENCPS